MPATLKIVSYNQTNLQNWQIELPNLAPQIAENQQTIARLNQTLSPLALDLQRIRDEISANKSDLEWMRSERVLYPGSYGMHIESRELSADINRIKTRLEALKDECDKVNKAMEPHLKAKKDAESKLEQLNRRQLWLTQHIPAAELFLQTLAENPGQLLSDFNRKILDAINSYQEQHFFGLSLQVRMSLQLIKSQLAGLQNSSTEEMARESYLKVCGLLATLHANVETENTDTDFLLCLRTLLEDAHVEPNVAPNAFHSELSPLNSYESTAPLPNVNFLRDEEARYERELALLLEPNATHHGELRTRIAYAAFLINSDTQKKIREKKPVDYYFYTEVARTLNAVYANPADLAAVNRLGVYAEKAAGAPSLSKKVVGALLAVAGALLVAASIAAVVLSAGTSAPFSAWGIALGLSAMQAHVTLGLGFGLGYGLTFWGGMSMASGTRHGLSKELLTIKAEAATVEHEPIPQNYAPAV